ncbi:ornithine carbamoyltransferase [Nonomuraea sp. NPDC049028]|uniref:ornithine carbamoyltransferase n=1 Tax=Nonomuraea sp. NPDC049028 TaxID=3364348 RepID=UPI00371363A5
MRHLISIDDLDDDEVRHITLRGARFAAGENDHGRPLAGQVVGIYFRRTSTRTRTAFSSGALRLGAQIVSYGPDDLQTNTGETTGDTGKVFSLMLDALVARTSADPAEMRGWAEQKRMSVVNAMSADEHPTQALADLVALQHHFGGVDGLRVLYVGEGNNTATALALALARFADVELEFRTPHGYGLPADLRERAAEQAKRHGSLVTERHDMEDLPQGFDVVYTTRWQTTGSSKADSDWHRVFEPFQVTTRLWDTNPEARFMHDLPAHRGEEVTAEVLDGPASIAFDQAASKLHGAMAVLEWCRAG